MDTSSHIIIGIGLGALAQIDPVVAGTPLSQAVFFGTVIGSNAPDFDYALKVKGNSYYYCNHRGWSHSLPALPLWALAVSGIIYLFFLDSSFFHLFIWTFLAVALHVLLDLFNVYGTQAFLPFTSKWIAFDAIPLLDPYILAIHVIGFAIIPFYETGKAFAFIYILLFFYIFMRTTLMNKTKKYLKTYFPNAVHIKLIPKTGISTWNVLIETKDDFLFGIYSNQSLMIEYTISRKVNHPELVMFIKNDTDITNFLASTHYAHPFVTKRKNGYFIYWKDLRFRTNKFFPCFVVTYISSDLNHKASFTGRLRSLKQYRRILRELEKAPKSLIRTEVC
ncbi:metal-dependent hydrolase [Peribacillus alkalitolerans]|uniref:metal-dependent hydrolase n=1 Tax=Peribacillus alkalitolerans TaxID=1550385 RepID=UPI0013D7F2FC|nr:metal-dependent hydrolase [Peribacillus alkalitolerans]